MIDSFRNAHSSFDGPIWQTKFQDFILGLSEQTKNLLQETHPLTQRVYQRLGCLDVQLIHSSWGIPYLDEARILNIPLRKLAFIREIFITRKGKRLWFGRSVTPKTLLDCKLRSLPYLGTKPLAQLVFARSQFKRSAFEFAVLSPKHSNYHTLWEGLEMQPHLLPARRSQFFCQQQSLLLTEIFLPDVMCDS